MVFLVILSLVIVLTARVSKVGDEDDIISQKETFSQSTSTYAYEEARLQQFSGMNTFVVDYTVSTKVHLDQDGFIDSLDPVQVTIGDLFISSVGSWSLIGPQDQSMIHPERNKATVDVRFQVGFNDQDYEEIHVVQMIH